MLIHDNLLFNYSSHFRIIEFGGSFGSGKTLTCFRLAHNLVKAGKFRYILSNLNSVWTDNPEKIVLREGTFVDAVIILDEGGLFMRYSSDAEKFMAGLRKLNVAILVPTVIPPATRIQFLTCTRELSLQMIGIPYWHYQLKLSLRGVKDTDWFGIYNPSEMYGIYDTMDLPTDDAYLSQWLEYWIESIKAKRPKWQEWGPPPGYSDDGKISARGRKKSGIRQGDNMDEIRREIDDLRQEKEDEYGFISSLIEQRPIKKGGKRG